MRLVATFLESAAEIQGLGVTLSIRAVDRRNLHSPLVGLTPFYTSNIMSASLAPECNEVKEYGRIVTCPHAQLLTERGNMTTAS